MFGNALNVNSLATYLPYALKTLILATIVPAPIVAETVIARTLLTDVVPTAHDPLTPILKQVHQPTMLLPETVQSINEESRPQKTTKLQHA